MTRLTAAEFGGRTPEEPAPRAGEAQRPVAETSEFVRQLKEQDPASLAQLYAAYGQKVYALAYRLTGNREEAEDITQETFLQICRKVGDFREQSRLYTWIYAIAKHLCYRSFQRAKKSSLASFETLIHGAVDTALPAEIEALEKEALIRQVKEGCLTGLLGCLSFNQRLAFILHVLLRLPVGTVAEILGKSEAATKVLTHRARQNLKRFLCRNCSAYDPANACRCESLLGFSLKHGWVERLSEAEKTRLDPRRIEEEIKRIRTVVELYRELAEPEPAAALSRQIQAWLRDPHGLIGAGSKT